MRCLVSGIIALCLAIHGSRAQSVPHASLQSSSLQFTAAVSPETVYAGAQISYAGIVRVAAHPAPRFLEIPAYTPPSVPGTVRYAMRVDSESRADVVHVGGATFTEYRYHHAFFPFTSGVDTLVSSLHYTVLNENDPYESPAVTRASPVKIVVVRPLPTAGRPPNFSGAVGQFTVACSADQHRWHVGVGGVVRATVTGVGNLSLVARPALVIPWATVAPMGDSITWDSTGTMMRGTRVFSWLVTPALNGPRLLPALRYVYFDPLARQYATATTAPIRVVVSGNATAPTDTLPSTPFPLIANSIRHFIRRTPVIGAIVVAILALVVVLTVRARRNDRH